MPSSSNSFGNVVSRFDLAVAGVAAHKSELPSEAAKHATELEKITTKVRKANAAQEKAKSDLAKLTKAVDDAIAEGVVLRGKIVKLAEATYGARGAEMKEFRPATEGTTTKQKTK